MFRRVFDYFRKERSRSFVINNARALYLEAEGEVEIYLPTSGKLEIPCLGKKAGLDITEIDEENVLVDIEAFEGKIGIPPGVAFHILGEDIIYGVVAGVGYIRGDDIIEIAYPRETRCIATGSSVQIDGEPSWQESQFDDKDYAIFESEYGLEEIFSKPVRYPINPMTLVKTPFGVQALRSISHMPWYLTQEMVKADKNDVLIVEGDWDTSFVSLTRYDPEKPTPKPNMSLYDYTVACLQGIDPGS